MPIFLLKKEQKSTIVYFERHASGQHAPSGGREHPMPSQKKTQPSSMISHPLGTEIYTTAQVAQALHLSVRTILRAIKSGKLTARRAGKQFLMTRDAVAAYWEGMPLAAEGSAADTAQLPIRWDDLAPEDGGPRRW